MEIKDMDSKDTDNKALVVAMEVSMVKLQKIASSNENDPSMMTVLNFIFK